MKKPELLAPVGHMEALKAAVFAGADGVYLGGKEFNARRNATNFSREEISEIITYCHLFQVKVYITINILLKDKELRDVLDYVHFLYHAGADALIVQDLGLFYLLRKALPHFPIHSSTQMFVHGLEGVKLLEDLGFERVVLAREMTTSEIKEVVDNTKAEIKIFNHGAMCVCYSGQCLMSSMIGGRSGNRGSCAQPCRKPYELKVDASVIDKGHLISPRDLNTLDIIKDLIETGADSFKIEGRKKSAQYVYTVVSAYRKLIDSYFAGNIESLSPKERLDIEQVFNRKFTTGYFNRENLSSDELIVKDNPKKRGIFVGEIVSAKKDKATVKLENHLTKGDGLLILGQHTEFGETLGKIWDMKGKEIKTAKAGEMVEIPLRRSFHAKDRIYKTSDHAIELKTTELLSPQFPRKLSIEVEVELTISQPLQVKMKYGNILVECSGEKIGEKAIKKPLDPLRVEEQFRKLGNTPFELTKIKVKLEEDSIVPISEINEVRRKAVELLTEEIVKVSRPKVEVKAIENTIKESRDLHTSKEAKLVLKTSRLDILLHLVKTRIDEIVFGGDISLDMKEYEEATRLCKDYNKNIVLSFPSVTRKDYIEGLKNHISRLKKLGPNGFLVSNYELLSLLKGTGLPIEADYKLNAFNVFTLYQLQDMGFSSAYLAQELNQSEINYICEHSPMSLGIFVHGNTELMVSQYSILGAANKEGILVDKLGYEFPVITDDKNRSHIFNSKKLSLYEEIGKIKNVEKFRIDISNEKIEVIHDIIEGYRDRLDGSSRVEESLKSPNPSFTKGHFRRGVE